MRANGPGRSAVAGGDGAKPASEAWRRQRRKQIQIFPGSTVASGQVVVKIRGRSQGQAPVLRNNNFAKIELSYWVARLSSWPRKPRMPTLPPVIFQDEALIAFNKPSGLLVSPDPRARTSVCLMTLAQEKFGAGLANVHRVEADASGLVLCAKTKPALDFVSGQFQSKTVGNYYEAIVVGAPPLENYEVDFVLKEDEAAPERMCVVKKHGQAAVTEFRVLARYGRFTHLECRPRTGRKHQIRVHLAASGTPILNDPVYGDETRLLLSGFKRGYKGREDERPLIGRLALHASRLTVTHPVLRERMTLAAPLPKDLQVALKYLGKYSA